MTQNVNCRYLIIFQTSVRCSWSSRETDGMHLGSILSILCVRVVSSPFEEKGSGSPFGYTAVNLCKTSLMSMVMS